MTFSFDFEEPTLFLVLYQHVSRKASVIHKYSKIPQATIYRYIHKIEKNINILERQKGQGRKETITDSIKKKVVRTTRRKPHNSTVRSLSNQYNIGKSSVDRILVEKNFSYRRVRIQKVLTTAEKRDRVTFCQDMIKLKDRKLLHIFYSDETGYNLSEAHRNKVWNPPNKQVKVDFTNKDIRVNCWGAISSCGATSLHIYKSNLKADTYETILTTHKEEMDLLYPDGYFYQHDNLSSHTAAEDWMRRARFNIVHFPSYSPDLSPIENIWRDLKSAVAKENPKTEKALCESLHRNWEALTTIERLQPYFKNLHKRYVECIEKNGNALYY